MIIKVTKVNQPKNQFLVGMTFEVEREVINIQRHKCYGITYKGEYYNIQKENAKVVKTIETIGNMIRVDFTSN